MEDFFHRRENVGRKPPAPLFRAEIRVSKIRPRCAEMEDFFSPPGEGTGRKPPAPLFRSSIHWGVFCNTPGRAGEGTVENPWPYIHVQACSDIFRHPLAVLASGCPSPLGLEVHPEATDRPMVYCRNSCMQWLLMWCVSGDLFLHSAGLLHSITSYRRPSTCRWFLADPFRVATAGRYSYYLVSMPTGRYLGGGQRGKSIYKPATARRGDVISSHVS